MAQDVMNTCNCTEWDECNGMEQNGWRDGMVDEQVDRCVNDDWRRKQEKRGGVEQKGD